MQKILDEMLNLGRMLFLLAQKLLKHIFDNIFIYRSIAYIINIVKQ